MNENWKRLGIPLFVVGLSACSTKQPGASDAELRLAHDRAAAGAVVYERDCIACHGRHGEGLAGVPQVMGEGSLPTHKIDESMRHYTDEQRAEAANQRIQTIGAMRGAFRDARDLHAFLVQHMPKVRQSPAPPSSEDYWQVTTYLLVVNGTPVPSEGVTASNAGSVPIKP